jgi:hypothetical protein
MDTPSIDQIFAKAGGRAKLQEALGLSKQSMSDWVRKGKVPLKHCAAVSAKTGIPLARLNDCFDMRGKRPVTDTGERRRSTDR